MVPAVAGRPIRRSAASSSATARSSAAAGPRLRRCMRSTDPRAERREQRRAGTREPPPRRPAAVRARGAGAARRRTAAPSRSGRTPPVRGAEPPHRRPPASPRSELSSGGRSIAAICERAGVAGRRRVERHPAEVVEPRLDPRVRVGVAHDPRLLALGVAAGREAGDDARRDPAHPQQERHRARVVLAVAALGVEQEAVERRAPGRDRLGRLVVAEAVLEVAVDGRRRTRTASRTPASAASRAARSRRTASARSARSPSLERASVWIRRVRHRAPSRTARTAGSGWQARLSRPRLLLLAQLDPPDLAGQRLGQRVVNSIRRG